MNLLQTRVSLSTNSIIDNTTVLKLLELSSSPFKVLPVCILYKNPLMFLVFKLSSQRCTTATFMIFIIKLSARWFFSESAICNVTVTVVFVLRILSQYTILILELLNNSLSCLHRIGLENPQKFCLAWTTPISPLCESWNNFYNKDFLLSCKNHNNVNRPWTRK